MKGRPSPRSNRTDSPRGTPVVLFDGYCPLCVHSVRFVLARDREARFRFAPLDSPGARDLFDACKGDPAELEAVIAGESVALAHGARLYVRSDAALRILAGLPWPWKALACLRVVPRVFRDRAYATLARRRHELVGRLDTCPLPDPGVAERFV